MDLQPRSEAAREANRRARRLLTARLEQHDPALFTSTLTDVYNDIRRKPEGCAYLLAALTELAAVAATLAADEMHVPVGDVTQTLARVLEREEEGI